MNRREALNRAASRLQDGGIESAGLEAEMLLSHITGIERHALHLDSDAEVAPEAYGRYQRLIKKRLRGVPIHYLIHEKEFMGLSFYVDRRVLIPRFDTEVLCETVLHWLQKNKGRRCLADIGTGSGALAVSLAHMVPDLLVTAVDCSRAALRVARRNARTHGVDGRITFCRGDLTSPLSEVDALVSNPPYVRRGELPSGEPAVALDGGVDGLIFYRRLAQEAPCVLSEGGLLALEIGYGQADSVADMMESTGQFSQIGVFPDFAGIPRVVTAIRK